MLLLTSCALDGCATIAGPLESTDIIKLHGFDGNSPNAWRRKNVDQEQFFKSLDIENHFLSSKNMSCMLAD